MYIHSFKEKIGKGHLKRHKKMKYIIKICIIFALFLFLANSSSSVLAISQSAIAAESSWYITAQGNQGQDIQWFKERMQIADKYVQKSEGILGMSWAHFLTMVLLVLFALAALGVFIQQQRRTKEIMESIRKETENGNSS